eukprot:PhF_6_TR18634/c0_g1_i1/m.27239
MRTTVLLILSFLSSPHIGFAQISYPGACLGLIDAERCSQNLKCFWNHHDHYCQDHCYWDCSNVSRCSMVANYNLCVDPWASSEWLEQPQPCQNTEMIRINPNHNNNSKFVFESTHPVREVLQNCSYDVRCVDGLHIFTYGWWQMNSNTFRFFDEENGRIAYSDKNGEYAPITLNTSRLRIQWDYDWGPGWMFNFSCVKPAHVC